MNFIPEYEFIDVGADKDHPNPGEATGTIPSENVSADAPGFAGSDWTNDVYFYRDVGDGMRESRVDIISFVKFDWEIETIIDMKEDIQRITIFKHKLLRPQRTDVLLHHAFVLLKTDNWYWTIEKNTKCILIQRSKDQSAVIDRTPGGEKRNTPIKSKKEGDARGGIIDLIDWLYREREQLRGYNVWKKNCQQFAERVYNFLTKWSTEIYLYRDVGSGCTPATVVRVPYKDLVSDFEKLIDMKAPIDEVYMYKHKLPDSQITNNLQHHYYVLFKSENWYWTIEKNAKYIILQRSKDCSGVKAYIQGAQRSHDSSEHCDDDNSVKDIGDLILWFGQVTKNPSTLVNSNSQEFAYRAYDVLTSWLVFHRYLDNNRSSTFSQRPFKKIEELQASLENKIKEYVHIDNKILKVDVCKYELPDSNMYHYFVSFESESWHWTIEKDTKCIVLQAGDPNSLIKVSVLGKKRNAPIKHVERERHGDGLNDIRYLIQWLCQEQEVTKRYHQDNCNSEQFAYRVYDHLGGT
ncbi:hypothetical protein ACF0H5_000825 [Mactra antiquata]